MEPALNANSTRKLHESFWVNAPGGVFAFDFLTGTIIDVNPAAESLSRYTRKELLGSHIAMLHPVEERERVGNEFLREIKEPFSYPGLHLQRKDGQRLPVRIRAWQSLQLDGRFVSICMYMDNSDEVEKEHLLSTQNWALAAYAGAALALGRAHSIEELQQSICAAITSESVYALAWIGIAEDDAEKNVRIAASAGSVIGYMDGLTVSWAEDDPHGRGPTGICIRTGKVCILEDTETAEIFVPWRVRARQAGIRSSLSIPFSIEENRRGALMVYSVHPQRI